MENLPCGCSGELSQIPAADHLKLLSTKQLRGYANSHCIGPAGVRADGFSRWRNAANHTELIAALNAHREGTILTSVPGFAPALPASLGSTHRIPELLDQLENLLGIVDPEAIATYIDKVAAEELKKYANVVQHIQVSMTGSEAPPTDLPAQHKDFPKLLRVLAARVHVMLVGPAGSGKTEASMSAAKALNIPFELISVGPQTMQSELAGYRNATGTYIESCVRRAYEQGKMLILDEMDAGNAGVFTFLNSTLSNAAAGYPDGVAERHPNFLVVACANTFGSGADMVYIGRSQLDGATLDRYATMVWDYDNDFELALALQHNTECTPWVHKVQGWRQNMLKHKIRHIISPRASINGAKLLLQGFTEAECAAMLVFKGLNKENTDKILGKAG